MPDALAPDRRRQAKRIQAVVRIAAGIYHFSDRYIHKSIYMEQPAVKDRDAVFSYSLLTKHTVNTTILTLIKRSFALPANRP